ncbi:SDR family NAD(P)-dependent oxidoreductase [Sphingopyxis chilensis]|uniref:SDR family NAD(P)-dependent oxidoreductase n=1 Tax=Sphingopyxis chilensis TaxID=180400 RepID=UPI002DDD087E|nr:SDR family NAD(P)-dependent oxidoreductase [Sphingopyxis chilensis]
MGALEGRVAIITGAGRGIGAAIARRYAAEGAKVVINDLGGDTTGEGSDAGPATVVAQEIIAAGGEAIADGGDIADVATGERLVRLAVETFGKLDIVVNVAGILRDRMIFNLDEADWDAVIRVHLKGHYATIKPAAAYWRSLRNPDGEFRIINFTSASGLHGSPGQPNYAAAKMGVVGLTMSLANGLARYGITVNAIAPGATTRLTGTVADDKNVDGPARADDPYTPERVAPIVVFLGSTESGWMSGRTIGAAGDELMLYNIPEMIKTIDGVTDLDPADLAAKVEKEFRPLADGLAPTVYFDAQM